MSELTATRNPDQSGRPLVWLLSLLSLLLLGFVTYTAIKHNPLYSDRDAYGISKYKLLEECKDALHTPSDLTVLMGGQPLKFTDLEKNLPRGKHLIAKTEATSSELVSSVQGDTQNKRLYAVAPVMLYEAGNAGESIVARARAVMQCSFGKDASGHEKLEVNLLMQ